MAAVIIGMDPHKRSATIEVIDEQENVLAQGRFGTDSDSYRTMLVVGRQFGQRVWAVEGGPGRTPGSDCSILRGRPNPHGRLFGEVTSRTR